MAQEKNKFPFGLISIVVPGIVSGMLLLLSLLLPRNIILKPIVHTILLAICMASLLLSTIVASAIVLLKLRPRIRKKVWSVLLIGLIWLCASIFSVSCFVVYMSVRKNSGTFEVDGKEYYYIDDSWIDSHAYVGEEENAFSIRLLKEWFSEGSFSTRTLEQIVTGTVEEGQILEISSRE